MMLVVKKTGGLSFVGVVLTGLLLAAGQVAAQEAPVRYSVSLEQRVHHEALITARFSDVPDGPLELRMSRTSPGRYRMHEFAKNIYGLSVTDGFGAELDLQPLTPSSWRVDGHHGTVVVQYTLFGDLLSGTYSSIDARRVVFNPPATFLLALGLEQRKVQVEFDLPLGWTVVSQIPELSPSLIEAPDLDYFLDSPIGLGTFDSRSWSVDRAGRKVGDASTPESERSAEAVQSIRLAVHHPGATVLVDRYQAKLERLVAEATAVFGELPLFDYGRYTFIANYLPFAHDDAMEHRNSTVHSSPDRFDTQQERLLLTLVHEFFHVWNVERIRPQSLEPFNFSALNPSSELWFAEGFTNYYHGLLLVRAGLWSEQEFVKAVSTSVNRFVNSPARRFGGAAYMSRLAAFNDRAAWVDPVNTVNTYLHYYAYGEALALALDLELRSRFDSDLDQLMRAAWHRFGVGGRGNERPYSNADLEQLLGELSSGVFASDFFERFVYRGEAPDYAQLLSTVGLDAELVDAESPWLGQASLAVDGEGVFVADHTRAGSPLYEAGLGRGDRLLELGERKLETTDDVRRALRRHKPGDVVRLVSKRRDEWLDGTLTLGRDPTVRVVPAPAPDSAAMAARSSWLASQVPTPDQDGTGAEP